MLKHVCRGTLVATILMAFLLMGCESTGPKASVGGLGGAAAGGLLARRWEAKAQGLRPGRS